MTRRFWRRGVESECCLSRVSADGRTARRNQQTPPTCVLGLRFWLAHWRCSPTRCAVSGARCAEKPQHTLFRSLVQEFVQHLELMESYRSIEAWKRAHAAVITTSKVTDESYQPRARALFDQLRRATISIEANIVEGYALRTPLMFRKHLRIARRNHPHLGWLSSKAGWLVLRAPLTADRAHFRAAREGRFEIGRAHV